MLGPPFYAKEGFLLYQVDCEILLRAITASTFRLALTVTSPPYNIGKPYEQQRALPAYLSWCETWMREIWEATDPNGTFWLNLGYVPCEKGRAVPLAYFLWDKSPFFLQQEVVWHYGAGVMTKRSFCPRNEKWLFFTKDEQSYTFNLDAVRDPNVKYPNQKKNGKYRCNPLGKNPSDVWIIPKVTTGANRSSRERVPHPTQFPLALVHRLIQVSSNQGDLVCDPFTGSGSAGIAAVGGGRVFIGSEVDRNYCQLAARRFDTFLKLRDDGDKQGLIPLE
jgi:adenine-specific DNA-methyltransferase